METSKRCVKLFSLIFILKYSFSKKFEDNLIFINNYVLLIVQVKLVLAAKSYLLYVLYEHL